MLRTSTNKLARPALLSRTFSTTARAMSAGDTGAPPKTGGQGCVFSFPRNRDLFIIRLQLISNSRLRTSDAFQKRERANEDFAIRQREKEKLLELRKKLAEQQAHLKQLSDHM